LRVSEVGVLVRPGHQRQALLHVKAHECRGILDVLVDVLCHDVDAGVELERQVVKVEAGLWRVEHDLDGKVVGCRGLLHPLLHTPRVAQQGRMLDQHVQGKDDVLGGKGGAVAPLHALAHVQRQLGGIVVKGVTLH